LKAPAAYYLMLLYITVMLKPLLPIVQDWYGHEFNPIAHEIQVHMVYGSHHLDKDLAESSSNDDQSQSNHSEKSQDQVSHHLVADEYKYGNSSISSINKFLIFDCHKLLAIFIAKQAPPPKFI
jgi:hypothetical protein